MLSRGKLDQNDGQSVSHHPALEPCQVIGSSIIDLRGGLHWLSPGNLSRGGIQNQLGTCGKLVYVYHLYRRLDWLGLMPPNSLGCSLSLFRSRLCSDMPCMPMAVPARFDITAA